MAASALAKTTAAALDKYVMLNEMRIPTPTTIRTRTSLCTVEPTYRPYSSGTATPSNEDTSIWTPLFQHLEVSIQGHFCIQWKPNAMKWGHLALVDPSIPAPKWGRICIQCKWGTPMPWNEDTSVCSGTNTLKWGHRLTLKLIRMHSGH